MTEETGSSGAAIPCVAPGRAFVIPLGVRELISPLFPVAAPTPLHAAPRERAARARLDWQAHVPQEPSDLGAPVASADPATSEQDDGRLTEAETAALRVGRLRGEVDDLQAWMRQEAAEGRRWPTAAEYATWTDDQLSRQYDLAHLDEVDWPEELEDPDGAEEPPEAHPLYGPMRDLRTAQQALREAESERVVMALRAWRAAGELLTGTPSAMVNGPFHRSLMMEIAHDLQVAEPTAAALVHTADAIDQRLPRCWDRFLGAEVPWRAMQVLHTQLDGLDERYWPEFDEQASEILVRTEVPRLKRRLFELRERIQARTAVDRHKKALARMSVGIEPAADGMALLTALLPAPEAVFIDQRLDLAARAAAGVEGEERSIGQLRAHILMDVVDEGLFRGVRSDDTEGLAVPERRGVQCRIGLLIPVLTMLGHSDEPALLDGYGPIDIETAKRLAGGAPSWIKVLTDRVTGAVIDIGREKYRPTSDMRALLGMLDRGGRGPGCTRPPHQTEADHIEPFRQGLARGRTALDNLVLLARAHHRVKTSGLWDIRMQALRVLVWTSFMGTRIITEVDPLPPTPVPERFLPAETPANAPPAAAAWADPDAPDELDSPF